MMLTAREKARIAYHLGYPMSTGGGGIGLGYPTVVEALYPVYGALNKIEEEALEDVRKCLDMCDKIEEKQAETLCAHIVTQIDGIQVNPNFGEELSREYSRWRAKLSNITGAPLNPMMEAVGGVNFRRA